MRRPSLLLLPLLLLLAGLATLAWWWPNRPRAGDVTMPVARFDAISFAPFRPGQSPLLDRFPSAAEVDQDMALVAGRTGTIRTYAALGGDVDMAALARLHGLTVWQGIWLGADRAQNEREMAAGIAIANRYPETVVRVVVGNEVLLRRDLPVEELIADIDRVKRAVRQPVTYADVWEFWQQFPQVAPHVDVVTIHLLPYWEDMPTGIDRAVQHVAATYRRIAALFPGKPVAIGETGWPSRGRWRRDAAPGRVNQAVFLRRFITLSHQAGFAYNLIEAFDQDWKYQNEGTVGANWGLWTAARAEKFPLAGPVQENPGWATDAALSVLAGLALLAAALCLHRRLAVAAQARLAVLSMALGTALVWAWTATVPVIYDAHLALAAAVNLPGQALLALLLLDRAGLILGGSPVPPPRTGADATATVQGLFRLRLPRLPMRDRPMRDRRTRECRMGDWRTREWRMRHWPVRNWLCDDLGFVFAWTAAVLQLLLLFDPRYRDFPLPVFIVPLIGVLARGALGDWPRNGGREALAVGGTLAVGAVASAIAEGPLNQQSLVWNAAALVLAAPLLRSAGITQRATCATPGDARSGLRPSQAQAPSASPTMPHVAL